MLSDPGRLLEREGGPGKTVWKEGTALRILKQLALIFGVCLAGDLLSVVIHNFLPGNVLGMLLMLLLLWRGWVKESQIQETADFFEHNMAFLFLPTCLGVLELSSEVLAVLGQILVIILITTLLTVTVTSATVKLLSRRSGGRKEDSYAA